ncbi:MAG: molybdenum-dependent transcriptional regulator, partial [Janthinobacterium lividum]
MSENPASREASPPLDVMGEIWLQQGARALGGRTRIDLLAAIRRVGSITSAARQVGVSYKTAWETIDTMNNLAGEPLVERTAGGRGGGGTRLTARGERLIATFERVTDEHQRFLARLGAAIEHFDTDWELIGRLAMKTSARNQLHGTISAIRQGAVNDEVVIGLPGGDSVVAVI